MTRVRWDRVLAVVGAIVAVLFLVALATLNLPWDEPTFSCRVVESPTLAVPLEICG